METTWKRFCSLFLVMLKIGLFTFGGGYAMIALLEKEISEKRGWLTKEEFLDMIALTTAAPGSVAVNASVYLGYQRCGIGGAVAATLGVCLPSFGILYLISLFYDTFMSFTIVQYAFRGIQVCVVYLIFSAGWNMIKTMKKSVENYVITLTVLLSMLFCTLCGFSFSTVLCIVCSGLGGVIWYAVRTLRKKRGDPS